MEEMEREETRRDYSLIKILGVVMLAFLMLVSTAGASPYAYITNSLSNYVSVIDTATDTVTSTVPVGCGSYGVAVNPAGTKVYVTNIENNTLSVIDTSKNVVTSMLYVGRLPYGIAVTPDGTKVYVANYGSNTTSVIDAAANNVIATLNVGSGPYGVAVTSDGTKVYIANSGSNTVSVIDTSKNTVTNTVNVGVNPHGVAITPDGTKAYVTNYNSNTVSVIDTATNTVEATVGAEAPFGVAVNPEGTKVYVGNKVNSRTATVSIIDTAANTVIDRVIVGNTPEGIAVNPAGTKVYVARYENSSVSVIDTATNNVTASVFVWGLTCAWGQFIVPAPTPVANLIIDSIEVPLDPVPVNTIVTTSANVTYLGNLNALTAEWNWGDGSISQSQASPNFETSHVYNSSGIYTITLTVKDNNGKSAKQKAPYYVVVYNPEGGFVTGGGWINSPAGAYIKDETLTGKATFGFVSKYENGATVPTGKTEFQFKVANLNFKSTSYDWLVVSGPQAKYKGIGTINEEGKYGFMLSAADGAIKGDDIDKFRIKIWDKESNDAIVYDNEIEAAEDAEPATSIGGGSIVIHKE